MIKDDLIQILKEGIITKKELVSRMIQLGHPKRNIARILKLCVSKKEIFKKENYYSLDKPEGIIKDEYHRNILTESEGKLFDYLCDKMRKGIVDSLDTDEKETLLQSIESVINNSSERLELYKGYLMSRSETSFNEVENGDVKLFLHISDKEANLVEEEIHQDMLNNKELYYQKFLEKYNFNPTLKNDYDAKTYLSLSDDEAEQIKDRLKIN